MKPALLKKALRLLVELAILCSLFLLGGQLASWLGWPIPGGVMGAPTLTDITRSIAILDYFRQEFLDLCAPAAAEPALVGAAPATRALAGAAQ